MAKTKIFIYVESRYKVNRKRMKRAVLDTLEEQNVLTPVEVSLAIVGDRKMAKLNKQYRDKDGTTNILSFPLSEGESSRMPDDVVRLGDVVISYPMVIKQAAEEDMLVDDRIDFLVKHGMLHLLGIHHN